MIIDRSVKWKTKFAFNLRVRRRRHEIGAGGLRFNREETCYLMRRNKL